MPMKNIVVIRYKRSGPINQGSFHKEDASFFCHGGEHEAKILQSWLRDNLVDSMIFSRDEWEVLPNDYPLEGLG
jgi:hypothetical protein